MSITEAVCGFVARLRITGADKDYFRLDEHAGRLLRRLGSRAPAEQRAACLDDLAEALGEMADLAEEFDPRSVPWTTPDEMARWTRAEATLVYAVRHSLVPYPGNASYPSDPGPAAGLWAQLGAERDPAVRADLMEQIAEVAAPWLDSQGIDGGQSVEVLHSLALQERKAA